MKHKRIAMGRVFGFACMAGLTVAGALLSGGSPLIVALAQAQTKAARNTGTRLDIAEGTKASYRVKEQLAGINFPDDAIGTTESVTGSLVLAPDGSINSAQSKLTIDLRTLKSDQSIRDVYIKTRTLETDKFPVAEFVPRRVEGLRFPLPNPERATEQSGFQLLGDLTIHGVTKEVVLTGYATFSRDLVAGRATTTFTFSTFGLSKPQLARVVSADDKITLEIEFRMRRSS
jgi:polyisoprenoid-binding protein YceI